MTIALIIVTIVVTAAAFAAVLYGVFVYQPKVEAAGESLGLEVIKTWARDWPPITLLIDPSFAQEDMERIQDVMSQASYLWNETTGLKLFGKPGELVPGGHTVPIMPESASVTSGDPAGGEHKGALAFVRLFLSKEGAISSSAIYLCDKWHDSSRVRLLRAFGHELGHVLGLAHDDYESSIMFPVVVARQFRVSERDKTFLQVIYGEDHGQG
jgi:hypothetical protein